MPCLPKVVLLRLSATKKTSRSGTCRSARFQSTPRFSRSRGLLQKLSCSGTANQIGRHSECGLGLGRVWVYGCFTVVLCVFRALGPGFDSQRRNWWVGGVADGSPLFSAAPAPWHCELDCSHRLGHLVPSNFLCELAHLPVLRANSSCVPDPTTNAAGLLILDQPRLDVSLGCSI